MKIKKMKIWRCELVGVGCMGILIGFGFLFPSALTFHESLSYQKTFCITTGYQVLPEMCGWEVYQPWKGYITFNYTTKNSVQDGKLPFVCGNYKEETLELLKKSSHGKLGGNWTCWYLKNNSSNIRDYNYSNEGLMITGAILLVFGIVWFLTMTIYSCRSTFRKY